MKKILSVLLFLALFGSLAFAGEKSYYIPSDVKKTAHTDYVQPVLESPGTGFLAMATPTIAVGTSAVKSIGTLPAGAQVVRLYAYGGDVAYGGNDLSTATVLTFPYVASGALSDPIPVGTTTPDIWVTGRTASASVRPMVR
jgi:hypothetical protein